MISWTPSRMEILQTWWATCAGIWSSSREKQKKKNEKMKNLMSNWNLPCYKLCLLPLTYLGNRILLAWMGWNWNSLPWIIKNQWLCWNYKTHIDKDTYIPFSTPPQWPILLQFCTQERTVARWYFICLSVIQAASILQQGSSTSFFVLQQVKHAESGRL